MDIKTLPIIRFFLRPPNDDVPWATIYDMPGMVRQWRGQRYLAKHGDALKPEERLLVAIFGPKAARANTREILRHPAGV